MVNVVRLNYTEIRTSVTFKHSKKLIASSLFLVLYKCLLIPKSRGFFYSPTALFYWFICVESFNEETELAI